MEKFQNDFFEDFEKLSNTDHTVFKDEKEKEKAILFFNNILNNVIKDKKILIVSDYDVDGFFSGIGLQTYLKIFKSRIKGLKEKTNKNIDLYFSKREDGYTLPEEKFNLLEKQYDYFIFLDTGSSYDYLTNKDNVSIIDHHPAKNKKNQKNLLNPNIHGSTSTSTGRIIYELAELSEEKLKKQGLIKKNHIGLKYIKMITSFTLLSDMAELDFINRQFLKEGISIADMNKKNFIFLSKMPTKEITSESLSFNLINLINSWSRMNKDLIQIAPLFEVDVDSSSIKYSLSKKEHEKIYNQIINNHKERKKIVTKFEKELFEEIEKDKKNPKDFFVAIINSNNKYPGVNGLLAQTAYQETNKPSIVISWDENRNLFVGSGRGYGVKEVLENMKKKNNTLEFNFGGHSEAIGIEIKEEEIEQFLKSIPDKKNVYEKEKKIYESSIKQYKEAVEYLNIFLGSVGTSTKYYSAIKDFEIVDSCKINDWNFVTIKDDEDFMVFYTKKDIDELKNNALLFEIENKEKNIFFLSNIIEKNDKIKNKKEKNSIRIDI